MCFDAKLKGDRDLYHRDTRVEKIVNLLLQDKTNVCHEIVRIINGSYTYEDFCTKMSIIYPNITECEESFKKFDEYWPHLDNIYRDHNCSQLRGALLEKFVYKILEKKYDYPSFLKISCYVIIKDWQSDKTVDVFYLSDNKSSGETFECKVSPMRIEKENVDNLKDIFVRSDNAIMTGIACFAHRVAIEQNLAYKNILPGAVKLLGFEDLKRMREIEIINLEQTIFAR